jgi:nitroreductase
MDRLDFLLDRRSIRRYTGQRIEQGTLEAILRAAMYAPSAVNRQPWHFVVVEDRSVMERIMEVHPHAGMLSAASHAIIVCGDEHLQHGDGYWVVDCGAATQNILLAAHLLGLGSCWVGLHPREDRKSAIASLLGLPAHVKPFALVALGYPAEQKPRPERFHPGKVKLNRWELPYFATES